MGPKLAIAQSGELFRQTLREQINLKHPLVHLCDLIYWDRINAMSNAQFKFATGRPATSLRLITGLLYLQHTLIYPTKRLCGGGRESLLAGVYSANVSAN